MIRFRLTLTVLLAALAIPASAQATTIIAPSNSPYPYQRWADESAVPTAPVTLEVIEANAAEVCGGPTACTGPGDPIWLQPFGSEREVRRTFRHELGHQFDYTVMPEWARARFESLLGMSGPWTEGTNPPNERFAEAWMRCSYSTTIKRRPVNYGYEYDPSPQLDAKVCRMIARVGSSS